MPILSDDLTRQFSKSCAQVAGSVAHPARQNPCGLKPRDDYEERKQGKSRTLGVRFRAEELVIVKTKAQLAGCTTNSYIRAAVLGSDYKQPINPDLQKALLALNRELTAQGNNLNQIARHLNNGMASAAQATAMLDSIRVPLVRALYAVKNLLAPQL